MTFAKALVANTDKAWFDHFRPEDRETLVDEVNFWRPLAQQHFHAIAPGEPFFLRLKQPFYAIAGFGFFATQSALPIRMAWEVFEWKNGDPDFERFVARITSYRNRPGASMSTLALPLTCIVLRDVVFLPQREWIPWGLDQGWSKNVVAYKGYDLAEDPGRVLAGLLATRHADPLPEFAPEFKPLDVDARGRTEKIVADRQGQGAFRLRLLEVYDHRCAATGEHALPVLDSAHIQPYRGPASNHVQNGLLLRTDLHRLYDMGYLTVTTDHRLEVSRRLEDEFQNGRVYYEMQGKRLHVPGRPELQPSRSALLWHAENIFK